MVVNEIAIRVESSDEISQREEAIAERTLHLKRSMQKLEEARRDNTQIEQITSHHFQEPLRKIQMYASLLQGTGNDARLGPEGVGGILQKITDLTSDLREIFSNVTSFAGLGAPPESLEPVAMPEVIASCADVLRTAFPQTPLDIRTGSLPLLRGIPDQLSKLFYELLHNAVRFSDRDGEDPVRVDVEAAPLTATERATYADSLAADADYCKIAVRDYGRGIDKAYEQKMFRLFTRLEAPGSHPVAGNGLAYARRIVQNHDGIIFFESELGAGSTFYVLLPMSEEAVSKKRRAVEV